MNYADKIAALDVTCEIEWKGPKHWEAEHRNTWIVELKWSDKTKNLAVRVGDRDLSHALERAYVELTGVASGGLVGGITRLKPAIESKKLSKVADDEIPF